MDDQQLAAILSRLRRQGTDDGGVEVKASAHDLGKSVWDSISAFANTDGGLLILGVEEQGFIPVETFAIERVRDQLIDGLGDGNVGGARLTNPPAYRLSRVDLDGSPVLVIEIDENPVGDKPCFVTAKGVSGGSFRRVDDKDLRLSPTEIFEFQHILVPNGTDRVPVDEAAVSDLDPDRVAALMAAHRDTKALRGVANREQAMTRLNITDPAGRVRLAGLLTLGHYPQQFLPRLLIDVTVHPTNEKSSPNTQLRFLDRVQCEGPLAEVVADGVNAVARNLRTYGIVEGTGRRDELEIPREVLREALSNAVVHREYHPLFQGQPVMVDIFPDRIVVTSPGGLWGGKTLDTMGDGVSRCRNQTLLQILRDVPLSVGSGAVVEGQGSGVPLMIHQMEAHALDRPVFRATPDQVSVELRRHGAEVPEHRAWLRSVVDRDLTSHEDSALVFARRHGHITVQLLQEALQIDSDEARAMLRGFLGEGVLRLQGPEDYVLAGDGDAIPRGDLDILDVLSESEPLDIHAVAAATRRSVGSLRPALRRLVEQGRVRPTAPPSSKNRRYLRSD